MTEHPEQLSKLLQYLEELAWKPVEKGGLGLGDWAARELSAERASLAAGPSYNPEADQVVLLASDTGEGIAAALLNAIHLRRAIGYWHEPPGPRSDPEAGLVLKSGDGASPGPAIQIVRVPRLRPDSIDFAKAAGRIGGTLIWAAGCLEPPSGQGVILHLAGGYKATIPFLVTVAEYVRGYLQNVSSSSRTDLQAWCLHESSPQPIRIPLRSLPQNRKELDELPRIRQGEYPHSVRSLEGWAYEGRELTPIGEALVELSYLLGGA